MDTALEAIGRLRVTGSSHKRAFIVEVMGRNCGYLALMAGVTGGAEAIVLTEEPTDPEQLAAEIRKSARQEPCAHRRCASVKAFDAPLYELAELAE